MTRRCFIALGAGHVIFCRRISSPTSTTPEDGFAYDCAWPLRVSIVVRGDTDGSGRWPARDGLRIEPSRHERVRMLCGGRLAQSSPGVFRRRTTFGPSRTLNTAIAGVGIATGKTSV